jgi:Tol biopolymer transport system component
MAKPSPSLRTRAAPVFWKCGAFHRRSDLDLRDSNQVCARRSPDGKWIAFISDRRVDADLYIMNADGTGEQLLTINDGKAEERDPAWSPDGEWIALSSNRSSPVFELTLLRPDGSDWQKITSKRGGDTRYACWKP